MTAIAIETLSVRTIGAFKQHARRAGLTLDDYIARRIAGEKRCNHCGEWKREDRFSSDINRWDGLYGICRDCNARAFKVARRAKRFPLEALAARLAAAERKRAAAERKAAAIAREQAQITHQREADPDVIRYRASRQRHQTEFERILPDARREFAAFLKTQEKKMRGGRPPKRRTA